MVRIVYYFKMSNPYMVKNSSNSNDPAGSANLFNSNHDNKNNEIDGAGIAGLADINIFTNVFPRCLYCKQRAVLEQVHEVSGTQIFWGCVLMCTMPVFCWVPFCLTRCDDRRLECTNCRQVRDYYQAPMCPYCCWYTKHENVW